MEELPSIIQVPETVARHMEGIRSAKRMSEEVSRQIGNFSSIELISEATRQMESLSSIPREFVRQIEAISSATRMSEEVFRQMGRSSSIELIFEATRQMESLSSISREFARQMEGISSAARISEEVSRQMGSFSSIELISEATRQMESFSSIPREFVRQIEAISSIPQIYEQVGLQFPDIISSTLIELDRRSYPFTGPSAATKLILALGLIPHVELRHCAEDLSWPPDQDLRAFAEQFASDVWPEIRGRIILSEDECLADSKIFCSFEQMLRAHDHRMFDLVVPAAVFVIERAIRSVQKEQRKFSPIEWLKKDVAQMSISDVGGISGFRVLKILIEHTFKSCWTDDEAEALGYPNRHAAAHGLGAKPATIIDSLNALLLAHFVISVARTIEQSRTECDTVLQ